MKLELYLRAIVSAKIRPYYIKEKCEICECEHDLELHHIELFSELLLNTLKQLNLDYKNDTREYEKEDLINIKEMLIGKHLLTGYLTLCAECHIEEHDSNRKEITNNHKKIVYMQKLRLKKDYQNKMFIKEELIPYLEEIVNKKLSKDNKKKFIDKVNHKKKGKQIRSYTKINEWFREENIKYRIIPKKSNDKRYWIIERVINH